jgi:hypothetical protein
MQDGKQGGITPFQAKGGNHTNLLHVAAINEEQKNWPTANARDWKDSITGTHPPSRPRMSEQTLGQAVSVVHGSWATPAARDTQGQRGAAANARKGNPLDTLPNQMAVYGQAAPASSSSFGSRQGLWPTPEGMAGGKTSRGGNRKDELLLSGMVKQWATPQAHDAQGPKTPEQIAAMRAKGHGVKNLNEMVTWPTPSASCDQGGPSGLAGGSGNRKKLNSMLPEAEAKAMGCGKLNPRWVETLMGLPIGWTMPSCTSPQTIAPMSCDSSAMELCPPPQSEPSEFSLGNCGNWTTPNQMDASIAKATLRPSRIATGRKTDYLARQVSMIQEP